MRAAVLRAVGAPLEIEELDLLPLGPRSVRVRVAASGVCHSDLAVVEGGIPFPTPVVLGHEGAGVVEAVGEAVRSVRVGDHVVLSWLVPCRRCALCLGGQVELCERGLRHAFSGPYAKAAAGDVDVHAGFGTATFGEETVVPEEAVVRIDPAFPLELAALVGCGVVTGVGAVVRAARVRPGETVAVIGCGGVGLAAVQGARLAGAARIVAVDRVPAKLDLARACGATDCVDGSTDDPVDAVRALTGGVGVDHAVEVVGRSQTIEQAYAMARRGGRVTVVGNSKPGDQVTFDALRLMTDGKTVQGCVYGSADPHRDIPALVRLQQQGRLDLERLVTRRIALDEVSEAFRAMQAGEVARSVVVFGQGV